MKHDIVIVGAGPVGLSVAVGLRDAGFSVALVEKAARPPACDAGRHDAGLHDARVYAIAPSSARLLQSLGAWPQIAATRAAPYVSMRVWDRDPARALTIDAGDAGAAQLGWIIEHGLIVDALSRRLHDVDCRFERSVESVQYGRGTGRPCRLVLNDESVIEASLIVAADGADSELRERAGIETVSWRYDQRAIVCEILTARPHEETARQRFMPTGPLALLPLANGRCSIVWSADAWLADELLALEDAGFRERLTAASQGVLGDVVEAGIRFSVPLRLLHAKEYVRDGLALVGDAAHAVHPLAGQGLNLGLADAAVLMTTIIEARSAGRDWQSLRALGRHARARKAVNLEMLAITDGLSRAFGLRLPVLRTALGLGLETVDRLAPVKEMLMRNAAGL